MVATQHHISVTRTARYFTLGEASPKTTEVWFACHGYGQLAEYFIRHFAGLANENRLIVAPEGLSRFYVKEWTRVGATWMTREDRVSEIQDYVAYLDLLYSQVFESLSRQGVPRDSVKIVFFAFSQGVTTMCRWLTLGQQIRTSPDDRLILWAGGAPMEMDWEHHKTLFQGLKPLFVYGNNDEFITGEAIQKQRDLWAQHQIECRFVEFDGEHKIEQDVLKRIVEM